MGESSKTGIIGQFVPLHAEVLREPSYESKHNQCGDAKGNHSVDPLNFKVEDSALFIPDSEEPELAHGGYDEPRQPDESESIPGS